MAMAEAVFQLRGKKFIYNNLALSFAKQDGAQLLFLKGAT